MAFVFLEVITSNKRIEKDIRIEGDKRGLVERVIRTVMWQWKEKRKVEEIRLDETSNGSEEK